MKKHLARQRSLLFSASVSALAFPFHAVAEETLPAVVVTATRTAQTADQSLASVTVIDREQIEALQPNSIADLLQTQAGIHISRNGGLGKATAVFIRGANNNHTLVLIDGVRASSATLGEFAWHTLSPQQIERIEIVRGPRASLYGSDAIGGVIQIFTRKNSGPRLSVSSGSDHTHEINVGTGGGEAWRYSVNLGRQISDGIPTHEVFSQDHGFSNSHATLGISGALSGRVHLDASATRSDTFNVNDVDTGDVESSNRTLSLRLQHQATDHWLQTLSLGNTLDQSHSFSPYTPSIITTRRNSASWQHDIELEQGLLSIGADLWKDHATKDDSGIIDKRIDNRALFAQYQFSWQGNDLLLGARNDDHSVFGQQESWNVAWGRQFHNTRVSASYGTAFKAPTINDLYWPYNSSSFFGTTYITQGNPAVQPETSNSTEISLTQQLSRQDSIRANLYRTRVRQLIEWTSTQTGASEYTYQPDNVSSVTIEGLELEASHRADAWQLSANAGFMNARNNSTRKQLDRRPRRTLTLGAARNSAIGKLHGELLAVSRRNDRQGATVIPGYAIINAMFERKLQHDLTLQLRADNLLDRRYTLVRSSSGDYNTYGRSLFVTLRYAPGEK